MVVALAVIGGAAAGILMTREDKASSTSEIRTAAAAEAKAVSPTSTPIPTAAPVPIPRPTRAPAPHLTKAAIPAVYAVNRNLRFGFSCDFPLNFLAQEASPNGDSFHYASSDGQAGIICYGENNVPGIGKTSARDEYQQRVADHRSRGDSVTYQALVGNASTVSGIQRANGWIYFERVLWGSGSVDTMIWTYPQSLKGQLEAAVEHSAATFRSGDLASGH